MNSVLTVLRNYTINGLIHNTGGGFIDNVPRILPNGCRAVIQAGSWNIPPIFSFLQDKGNIPIEEMYRTFNMGIGMMALVAEENVEDVMQQFTALNETPVIIGDIVAADDTSEEKVRIEGL